MIEKTTHQIPLKTPSKVETEKSLWYGKPEHQLKKVQKRYIKKPQEHLETIFEVSEKIQDEDLKKRLLAAIDYFDCLFFKPVFYLTERQR